MIKLPAILRFLIGCYIIHFASSVTAQSLHLDDICDNYRLINYKNVDGTTLSLHMFRPKNHRPSDHSPALVFIHGGGFISGHPYLFFPHCRYFASRGAVAFSINYRIIKEKGLDGLDAIGDCITDCKSAVRYIRKNAKTLGIDPSRIAVIGDSAGGHLAACLGMIDDFDAPDEDLTVSSMADAMVLYNPGVDLNLPVYGSIFGIREFGSAEMERIKKFSPVTYISPGLPPALLLHGTEDSNIPIGPSISFAGAMKKAGNRCDMPPLEGVKHAFVIIGIGTEETIVGALRETDRFLASIGFLEGEPTIEMSK